MLFVVGVGLPAYVIRQVYKIRWQGSLTILTRPRRRADDIYRDELSRSDKLEIAQISRDALARKTAAAKAIANEVEIVEDQTDMNESEEDVENTVSQSTFLRKRRCSVSHLPNLRSKARERAEKMP